MGVGYVAPMVTPSHTIGATPTPVSNGQRTTGELGIIVFLASDIMLFAPFFAAYFLLRATNDLWPAGEVELEVCGPALATRRARRVVVHHDRRRSGAGPR